VFENKQLKTCACVVQIKNKNIFIYWRKISLKKNQKNCKKEKIPIKKSCIKIEAAEIAFRHQL
jgi:hypothetical protein